MSEQKILKKLTAIEKRLNKIEEDITEIKAGISRNDANITLMTRLYFVLRSPIIKLLQVTGNYNKDIIDIGEDEIKFLKN